MTKGWAWQQPEFAARARAHAEQVEREAQAAVWEKLRWEVYWALNGERHAAIGRDHESAYLNQRAIAEGRAYAEKPRRRGRFADRFSNGDRAWARAFLDGMHAAERAAAADWPPGVRQLLVLIARDDAREGAK